jgi:hypothetical protein
MIWGCDAYRRVYEAQAARDTFLIAIPEDIQDEILIAARDLFPPTVGFYDEHGPSVGLN